MNSLAIIYWIILLLLVFTYLGYSLIAAVVGLFREKRFGKKEYQPHVTIIIPEYNEAKMLPSKIENCLALNYPKEKLHILVVSDGSRQESIDVLNEYDEIEWVRQDYRMGKAAALNRAMSMVDSPIVVFSDANCILNRNSIRNIVTHFANRKIGAVAGEKKVLNSSGVGTAEGWYWKYESLMKKADAAFYSVVGATGELFAIRTCLFKPIPEWMILDDLYISLKICLQNHRIAYEPSAFATEAPSATLADEKRRKLRIAAGAFQLLSVISLADTFKVPKLGFQFLSRRWMRWILSPVIVPMLFIVNTVLAVYHPSPIYDWLLAAQGLFYFAAFMGWQFVKQNKSFALLTIPFYFIFMNYCMVSGWFRYKNDKETVLWKKAERTLV